MRTQLLPKIFFVVVIFSAQILAQTSNFEFPLATGNIWQYSEFPGHVSQSEAVRDTLMPNGKLYTLIEGSLVSGYFREDSAKIYFYSLIDNTEKLEYDFNLTVGDTLNVQIFGEDSVITTVSAKGTTSIFGQEKDYMIFHRESVSSTADGEYTIVDGLGLTQYSGEVLFYGLTGAIIDGVTYGTIVSVEREIENMPTEFGISQNFPNPFNPSTYINYTVSEPSFISIKVYDVLGNEIEELVSEVKETGNHSVKFNAPNLASGVYFYTLKANGNSFTKKMLLVK